MFDVTFFFEVRRNNVDRRLQVVGGTEAVSGEVGRGVPSKNGHVMTKLDDEPFLIHFFRNRVEPTFWFFVLLVVIQRYK